jgi:hypothetical protein
MRFTKTLDETVSIRKLAMLTTASRLYACPVAGCMYGIQGSECFQGTGPAVVHLVNDHQIGLAVASKTALVLLTTPKNVTQQFNTFKRKNTRYQDARVCEQCFRHLTMPHADMLEQARKVRCPKVRVNTYLHDWAWDEQCVFCLDT